MDGPNYQNESEITNIAKWTRVIINKKKLTSMSRLYLHSKTQYILGLNREKYVSYPFSCKKLELEKILGSNY